MRLSIALSTIQTIVRVAAPVAAPVNVLITPEAAGGGAAAVPVARGDSQEGENCEQCDQFVPAGDRCNCDHIVCRGCDTIVDATLGPCHGCGVTLGSCCGVLLKSGEPTCHACSTLENEEAEAAGDLVEMVVKGVPCLYQPTTGVVAARRENGAPGVKISTFTDGVHKWEWNRKKIGGGAAPPSNPHT